MPCATKMIFFLLLHFSVLDGSDYTVCIILLWNAMSLSILFSVFCFLLPFPYPFSVFHFPFPSSCFFLQYHFIGNISRNMYNIMHELTQSKCDVIRFHRWKMAFENIINSTIEMNEILQNLNVSENKPHTFASLLLIQWTVNGRRWVYTLNSPIHRFEYICRRTKSDSLLNWNWIDNKM